MGDCRRERQEDHGDQEAPIFERDAMVRSNRRSNKWDCSAALGDRTDNTGAWVRTLVEGEN